MMRLFLLQMPIGSMFTLFGGRVLNLKPPECNPPPKPWFKKKKHSTTCDFFENVRIVTKGLCNPLLGSTGVVVVYAVTKDKRTPRNAGPSIVATRRPGPSLKVENTAVTCRP